MFTSVGRDDCEEFACRLPKDNSKEFYAVQTNWFKDKVTLNVWDNKSLWTGEVTTDAFHEFSNTLGINYDEYFLECKQILTKKGGNNQFVYSVENSHFVWKKIDKFNNIRVKFGCVEVKSVPFTEDGIAILNISFNCVLRLSDAMRVEEERKLKSDEEMERLKQKLIKLCEEKDKLEKDLYAKFLSILNQKKEKIRDLEERCIKQDASLKKAKPNRVYSDSECDVDDPSSLTCRTSPGPSVKKCGKTMTKMTNRRKQTLDVGRKPLEPKHSVPPSVASAGKDHYSSDTDVDMTTDDEDKPTFNFVASEPNIVTGNRSDDDLFSEMNSPPAVLPKRTTQIVVEERAGPSFQKTVVKNFPVAGESSKISESHDFNTQDLFDDLGVDN